MVYVGSERYNSCYNLDYVRFWIMIWSAFESVFRICLIVILENIFNFFNT